MSQKLRKASLQAPHSQASPTIYASTFAPV